MILIMIKMPIRPEKTQDWLDLAQWYSEHVRAEPGNAFFSFSRSLEDEHEYVCVEGFQDDAAGKEHMKQDHVPVFMDKASDCVARRPQIIYVDADEVTGWNEMGEIGPRD